MGPGRLSTRFPILPAGLNSTVPEIELKVNVGTAPSCEGSAYPLQNPILSIDLIP